MAPKRKAPAAGGRATKRVASGVATPVSQVSSDEDDSMGTESDPEEREPPQKFDSQWLLVPALYVNLR